MSDVKKFLTYAPLTWKLREGEFTELAILALGEDNANYDLTINTYHSGQGSPDVVANQLTIKGGRVCFAVTAPDDIAWSTIIRIEVLIHVHSDPTGIATEKRIYYPDRTCRKDPVRIGWLNTLGGIDYYTFTGSLSAEVTAERSEYVKDLPSDFTEQTRTAAVLAAGFKKEFEAVTDFEPETVYDWISKILISPEVWIVEGNKFHPIMITGKTTPVKNNGLFQLKLKYRKSTDIFSQNG